MGKAGDGMVFETCIPGVGKLQVSGEKRKPGPVPTAGLILNTDTASLLASGGPPNQVTLGADLFSASVKATLRPSGGPSPGSRRRTSRSRSSSTAASEADRVTADAGGARAGRR